MKAKTGTIMILLATLFASCYGSVSSKESEVRSEADLASMNEEADRAIGNIRFGMSSDTVDILLEKIIDEMTVTVDNQERVMLGDMMVKQIDSEYVDDQLWLIRVQGYQVRKDDTFMKQLNALVVPLWKILDEKYGDGTHLESGHEAKLAEMLDDALPSEWIYVPTEVLLHSWRQEGQIDGVIDPDYKTIELFIRDLCVHLEISTQRFSEQKEKKRQKKLDLAKELI